MAANIARGKRNVIIAMNLAAASGRDRLTGLFKYLGEGHGWDVNLVQDVGLLTPEAVRQAQCDGVDGFIIGVVVEPSTLEELKRSKLPVVFTLTPDESEGPPPPRHVHVHVDNMRVGAEAAKYLSSIGVMRSFGYFTGFHRHYGWSRHREAGFREELAKKGIIPSVFRAEDASLDTRLISKWLASLEKPAAILAGCDLDGQTLLEVCRSARIAVPEQVALIGVENDEFVCNCSRPSLSSIQPANREVGYRAAVELDRLMRGKPGDWRVVLRNPVEKLVERESSRVLPPAGHLIRDALAFIRENACTGIRAGDVSRHLRVSRRLLDLRFHQIQKGTILDAITEVRVEEAKRRLERTGDSMAAIAAACGYTSAGRLAKVFHAKTGATLSDWRRAHQ